MFIGHSTDYSSGEDSPPGSPPLVSPRYSPRVPTEVTLMELTEKLQKAASLKARKGFCQIIVNRQKHEALLDEEVELSGVFQDLGFDVPKAVTEKPQHLKLTSLLKTKNLLLSSLRAETSYVCLFRTGRDIFPHYLVSLSCTVQAVISCPFCQRQRNCFTKKVTSLFLIQYITLKRQTRGEKLLLAKGEG
ncbi:hypothetical protein ACROYT_G017798 [Oculina patagonica]